MSDIVLKHGGTLDKFVGDALVAFWGAPIARLDDADRAVRAGRECTRPARNSAAAPATRCRRSACTRVGLHRGEAIVGNFGGEGRIQYTALGDAMNTGARLESANKALKTTMLVSDEARARDQPRPVPADGPDRPFRPGHAGRGLGAGARHAGGAAKPPRHALAQLRRRATRTRIVQLESIAAEHKDDAALQYFVYRLREVGPGGHFVLGSK